MSIPAFDGKVLVLRTCAADMTAHGGFKWSASGQVSCPDWDPKPECGNGLHGLLWGDGDWSLMSDAQDARWLVVEVDAAEIVSLGSKVKFPRGNVLFCGSKAAAITRVVCGRENFDLLKAQAGDNASSGDRSTAASSGDLSTAASSGDRSTAASSGDRSTAASSGDLSTAASSGEAGIAMVAGYYGQAKAGPNGAFALAWNDNGRPRILVGIVGEDGIEADTWYRAEFGRLVKA